MVKYGNYVYAKFLIVYIFCVWMFRLRIILSSKEYDWYVCEVYFDIALQYILCFSYCNSYLSHTLPHTRNHVYFLVSIWNIPFFAYVYELYSGNFLCFIHLCGQNIICLKLSECFLNYNQTSILVNVNTFCSFHFRTWRMSQTMFIMKIIDSQNCRALLRKVNSRPRTGRIRWLRWKPKRRNTRTRWKRWKPRCDRCSNWR